MLILLEGGSRQATPGEAKAERGGRDTRPGLGLHLAQVEATPEAAAWGTEGRNSSSSGLSQAAQASEVSQSLSGCEQDGLAV